MKAIVVSEFGPPEVMKLTNVDTPKVGDSQILVRVEAAGVNPVDTYIRSGLHAIRPTLPFTPGKDGAGIVEAVGAAVVDFKPGDRVYLAGAVTGTYAEFALCEASQVHALPDNVDFDEGAGVFVPYATAWRGLFEKANARPGETVLIHGASGGVGIAAIQWAKHAGLTVLGTASSEEGKSLAKQQGADFVFDHTSESYLDEILAATGGKGVDIVLEMLANVNLVKDFEVLRMFGRIVVIGNRGSLDFNPRLTMGKDASILGLSLFNAKPETMSAIHVAIYEGLQKGYLKPVVGKRLKLDDAAQAHHDVIEHKAFGKIVLVN
ncbi:MAG: NADPH:quinone reductase [Acidobacteria bacterium]|nr:NADPH:quinone reductase [Acidobacteriota bacterium]